MSRLIGWAAACFALSCGGSGEGTASSSAALSAAAAPQPSAASSVVLPPWVGIPVDPGDARQFEKTERQGPFGTVTGKVRIEGDAPPDVKVVPSKDCPSAAEAYGKAFRRGPDGGLADALIAVTGYDGFVAPTTPTMNASIKGCAFDSRLYALTFGQRLEVTNQDPEASYTPFIDGVPYKAVMIAMPGGSPIKLYPPKPMLNYVLRDFQGRAHLEADVMVLKYSTHDVSKTDGTFRISRVPVGKVDVNGFLPSIGKATDTVSVEVVEGKETVVDLVFTFDSKKDKVTSRSKGPFEVEHSSVLPAASSGAYGGPPAVH